MHKYFIFGRIIWYWIIIFYVVKEYHSIKTINDQKHEITTVHVPCYFVYNIIMQQPSTPNTMSLDMYYSNMMVYMIDIYHSTKWLYFMYSNNNKVLQW